MAFNFQKAIEAGATEREIRAYLRARGREDEADKHFKGTEEEEQPEAEEKETETPGILKSIFQDVAKPFAMTGLTTLRAGKGLAGIGLGAVGKLTGKERIQQKGLELLQEGASQEPADIPFFGRTEPVTTKKQALGTGLEIGGTIATGGALPGIAKTGLRQAGVQAIKRGFFEGARGGALIGAGRQLGEGGQPGISTLFGAGAGALGGGFLGGLFGGGASLAGRGLGRVTRGIRQRIPGPLGEAQIGAQERVAQTLQEKVVPALTKRERQIAISQGRVTRGGSSKLTGTKPDIVRPDRRTSKAIDTLQRRIKGVNKMDDIQIANSAQSEITSISNKLKPQMRKVQVKPETTKSARRLWDVVKESQTAEPEFDAFPGSKKFQQRFEGFLNEMIKPVRSKTGKFRRKNLNDLWEIAKRYDDIVPERVKQANELSSDALQFQKDMWLQNRRILRDIIEDASDGLGSKAKKAFSDMTDLYRIRNNIIQKGDIVTEAKPGLLRPRNVAVGAGALGLTAGLPPFLRSIVGGGGGE